MWKLTKAMCGLGAEYLYRKNLDLNIFLAYDDSVATLLICHLNPLAPDSYNQEEKLKCEPHLLPSP